MGLLSSGELDRYIQLCHKTVTENNANGERVPGYSAFASVYAKRADLKGTKRLIAQQTTTQQQTEFTIRYRTDVSSSDRVIDETGLAYEILQIAQVGRREGLSLLCRATLK